MRPWADPAGQWFGRVAFVLGGGPSLSQDQVDLIRGRGHVIAVNDAGFFRAPWADVLFFADGVDRWFGWNRDKLGLFEGPHIVTRADNVPPDVPRLHKVKFAPRAALARDPGKVAGFCGGSSAINLAFHWGARVIVLLGFDMRAGNWHDNHKAPPARHDSYKEKFIPALRKMAPELAAEGTIVLNATPGSALDVFPAVNLEELLALDATTKTESEKYRRMWANDGYRKFSPGAEEVERAHRVADIGAGESVIDFGAGTGRATAWLKDQGVKVLAVDFVPEALEVDVPFLKACLWQMDVAGVPGADVGLCCDVMEHIPPGRVGQVLLQIAARCRRGCYFRIATRPDVMGQLIGERLHLTVESADWWRLALSRHWSQIDLIESNDRDAIFWCRP